MYLPAPYPNLDAIGNIVKSGLPVFDILASALLRNDQDKLIIFPFIIISILDNYLDFNISFKRISG